MVAPKKSASSPSKTQKTSSSAKKLTSTPVEKSASPKAKASKPAAKMSPPAKTPAKASPKASSKTIAKPAIEAPAKSSAVKAPSKPVSAKSTSMKAPAKSPSKPAPKPASKASSKSAPKPSSELASPVVSDLDRELITLAHSLAQDAEWQAFVEVQKKKLLDLRDICLDNVASATRDTLRNHPEGSEASASGEHTADAGSDAYDREFALSLLSSKQDLLYEIEGALERLSHGVYGICEISYKLIPRLRLEAIPFARLTVECQAQWEKENGTKVRFRPKKSVLGYSSGQIDLENATILLDEDEN